MKYINIGTHSATTVVFAHGWNRTRHDFIPVAESIAPFANCILLDLPGFGESPRPDDAWGSAEYADHIAQFLDKLGLQRIIWVGHSFGGRIGLRMAVNHPQYLSAMVLVASAGIPLQQSLSTRLRQRIQRYRFQAAKKKAKNQDEITELELQYGSADYVQSGELGLRDIFLRVIAEDQSSQVVNARVPTRLIYGAYDFETPVAIGKRLQLLIPDAQLVVCPEFNHIDILSRGRHQIAMIIKELLHPTADAGSGVISGDLVGVER